MPKTILESVQENLQQMSGGDKTPETDTPPVVPSDDKIEEKIETKEEVKEEAKETPKEAETKDDDKKIDAKKSDKAEDKGDDNVEIDEKFKVVSYDRFKKLNEKMKTIQAERDELLKNNKTPEFEDEEEKEKYEEFKKMWFQNKGDVELSKLDAKEEAVKEEERKQLDKEIYQLERDFDWKDWLPQFKKDDVLKFWVDNQVYDPKSAYIIMNLNKVINHFVAKELKAKGGNPNFNKANEAKQPDISGKDKKLNTSDWSLKTHLKDVISWLMSG